MLVRLANGKTNFFDYREMAPGKATRDMYIKPDGKLDKEASVIGYRSVAVPGTVAGLALALKTHGTMKLADVMQPAIRYAEQGIPVTEKLVREFQRRASRPAALLDEQPHFPERRQDVPRGRHASPARACRHAETHREKRPRRILQGRNRANARPRHGFVRRLDHSRRPRALSTQNSRSPPSQLHP